MADNRSKIEARIKSNIDAMNSLAGFDVIIICCSSELQASYWQKRLNAGKGAILSAKSIVVAVHEDWPGGAGNALGTLYAYQCAIKIAQDVNGMDIDEQLRQGKISVALYHTAGKGTRLAPLPGAENNNKPGVKLPVTYKLEDGRSVAITILEAVIKQTGCYAKSRRGRLSVFWGDQVFIPSSEVLYTPNHHVDILCSLGPMPTPEVWRDKGLDKYGIIARNSDGHAAQVEKVDHATAQKLLEGLGTIEAVGASLGSFSVSSKMLIALLSEFAEELASKQGKLDTDPHLWMPMTLGKERYLEIMAMKGITEETSGTHYDRIAKMMENFWTDVSNARLKIFGAVDVGPNALWWDYGQLKLYQKNVLLLTALTAEAKYMRQFFRIEENLGYSSSWVSDTDRKRGVLSKDSVICNSIIGDEYFPFTGSVKWSTVCGVKATRLFTDKSIIINVTARIIRAEEGSIIYNVHDDSAEGLTVGPGEVLAGVIGADGVQTLLRSNINIDGGKVWADIISGNNVSFEQIYNENTSVCPGTVEDIIAAKHTGVWQSMPPPA